MSVQSDTSIRIQAFTVELESLVRRAALDAVATALGGGRASEATAPRANGTRRGRPRSPAGGAPGKAVASDVVPSATKLTFKRRKGSKRTATQLAQIDAAVLGYIKTNAGNGVEHMARALAIPSSDLKARVAQLVAGKKIKKSGVKRATKYFPN